MQITVDIFILSSILLKTFDAYMFTAHIFTHTCSVYTHFATTYIHFVSIHKYQLRVSASPAYKPHVLSLTLTYACLLLLRGRSLHAGPVAQAAVPATQLALLALPRAVADLEGDSGE